MKIKSITVEICNSEGECLVNFDNGWVLAMIGSGFFHERVINAALNTSGKEFDIKGLMFFDKCNVAFLSADQRNAEATLHYLTGRAINFIRHGIVNKYRV